MSVFADKKFEELDWISQATEPIDSKLNVILSKIPDEIELTFDFVVKTMTSSMYTEVNPISIIRQALYNSASEQISMSWDDERTLKECFEFQYPENAIIDFERKFITPGIKMVKLSSTLDEKVLEAILGREGIVAVGTLYDIPSLNLSASLSRANEIIELLGKCDDGLRTKSFKKKRGVIVRRLKELFKTNEWKIKDTELANKVGFWIKSYILEGDLAAFSNFCRLKVMTHKELPIYSMEEVK